jgi:hypothetical protein
MALLLLLLLCSCAPIQYEFATEIVGESNTTIVKLDLKIGDHRGSCNGFLFEPQSRAVLTAAHCVASASWIGVRRSVVVDGRLLVLYQIDRYEVAQISPAEDVAILLPFRAITEQIPLPSVEQPHRGEVVYFYDRDLELRSGVLLNSGFLNTDFSEGLRVWVIEHQAQKGDSGSPVFDENGAFVGLIVAGNVEQGLTFLISP